MRQFEIATSPVEILYSTAGHGQNLAGWGWGKTSPIAPRIECSGKRRERLEPNATRDTSKMADKQGENVADSPELLDLKISHTLYEVIFNKFINVSGSQVL